MKPRTPSRRKALQMSGTALALSLAGCTGMLSNESEHEDGGHSDNSGEHEDGGHSGDSHGHSGNNLSEAVDHAEVTMVTKDGGTHFEPHAVRVKPGGSVTWKLESGSHSTTAYHSENDKPVRIPEGAKPWDSGTLSEQGKSFTHTFETEGVYDYFCIPHEATGMLGTVVVGSPHADGQPGLQPPQESLPSGAQEKIKNLNEKVSKNL